ncbi:hypothetical protein FPE49_001251 [Salmonella bongori]|nr:hypothetical protein [Salmonella bongori]EDP8623081.1 hypothetical protein [Salmonella bongori]
MIRSGTYIMATVILVAALNAHALTSNDFDPRDPTIWQEEQPPAPYPLVDVPCEVRSGPHCARWEDEKSNIQRERERREQRRWQNGDEKKFRD